MEKRRERKGKTYTITQKVVRIRKGWKRENIKTRKNRMEGNRRRKTIIHKSACIRKGKVTETEINRKKRIKRKGRKGNA